MADGRAVCNFTIATTINYKNKEGEKEEITDWHKIAVWGKQAESFAEKLNKGSKVYVEGILRTYKWEKEGQKQQRTQISAKEIQILSQGNKN